jgi:hypothetical protein
VGVGGEFSMWRVKNSSKPKILLTVKQNTYLNKL